MSAALKATTLLSSIAVAGAGAAYTPRTPNSNFSQGALAAAEHGVSEVAPAMPKPKLPTNFFEFSLGTYKISNVRSI